MVSSILGGGAHMASNVEELFDYEDSDFIRASYLTLLGREPDPVGFDYYLDRLNHGVSRVQIIDQICASPEMTAERRKLAGLELMLTQWRRSRWPVIGGLFRPPELVASAGTRKKLAKLEVSLKTIEESVASRLSRIEQQLESSRELLAYLREHAREATVVESARPRLGAREGQTFIFNLSTSHHWRAHPVGIVRVERELAKYLTAYENVQFVLWDSKEKIMRRLDGWHVDAILSERWCDNTDVTVAHFSHAALVPFSPKKNDVFVSLGLDWDQSPVHDVVDYLSRIGVKFITACYDLVPVLFPEFAARQGMDQMFRRHFVDMGHAAASVFAISDKTKHDLEVFWQEAEMGIALPRVEVVPLGAAEHGSQLPDLNAREVDTLRHVLSCGDYVLYVSSFEARKNHRLLVNVWRELHRIRGKACPQLLFVGMQGWGVDDLRNQIGRMPAFKDDGKIVWLNNVSDALLAHFYANCSFTVFPSFYEGWGLAATEAMSYGKACVIANNSSLQQATQGLMPAYHPGDYFGWKAEVERLIDDADYRKSLEDRVKNEYHQRTWAEFSREFCDRLLVGA